MQKVFTHEFLKLNRGCYTLESMGTLLSYQPEEIQLSDILNSGIPIKDKFWFICKILATKEQNQQIAIAVAEIVLPIYEKRYPENKAPREAIEAAKQFIAGHISLEELSRKRAAAAYAAAAAYDAAAYAAAAAAYDAAAAAYDAAAAAAYAAAAYAAAAAYDAAAYAYAAAAAAYDAAAYAAYDAVKQQLLTFLIKFCENA